MAVKLKKNAKLWLWHWFNWTHCNNQYTHNMLCIWLRKGLKGTLVWLYFCKFFQGFWKLSWIYFLGHNLSPACFTPRKEAKTTICISIKASILRCSFEISVFLCNANHWECPVHITSKCHSASYKSQENVENVLCKRWSYVQTIVQGCTIRSDWGNICSL